AQGVAYFIFIANTKSNRRKKTPFKEGVSQCACERATAATRTNN
ncbi:MAG: hypothetical protein ACI8W7_000886, partial [Gammaproteobacteria bacterium]